MRAVDPGGGPGGGTGALGDLLGSWPAARLPGPGGASPSGRTLRTSPGARAYYDHQRARGAGHNPALRQLANRLTGILHGCLKTRTLYHEATAWPQYTATSEKTAA